MVVMVATAGASTWLVVPQLFMRCVAVTLRVHHKQTAQKAFYNVARLLVDILRLIYQFMI